MGDLGSIPGSGRSSQEGHGNPLQYSCLENPMDRGAWQATVHGVAKSRTQDTTKQLTLSLSSSKHTGSSGTGKNFSSVKWKGNCNGNLFAPCPNLHLITLQFLLGNHSSLAGKPRDSGVANSQTPSHLGLGE